jgi:hypothetical protein
MKFRTFLPILAVAAFAVAYAGSFQQGYLLRLNHKPNTSDKYKIELVSNQQMNAPGAPPNIDVKGSMDFEVNTGDVKEGLADVEMKTTNLKIDAGELSGMMRADQMPKEIVTKAKLDDRYRLTQATTSGLTPQAQMMMGMSGSNSSAMFFELPEKPVKLGDTWEVSMPKNPMFGEKEHKLIATLVSLKEYDGAPVYEFSVRGKFDFDVNMADIVKAMAAAPGAAGADPNAPDLSGMDMRMKGIISISGSALVSRADAKMHFSTMKMESKQTMSVMGMDIDIAGTTTVNMKLAK